MAVTGLYRSEKKNKPIEAHRPTLSKQELESVLDALINDRLTTGPVTQRFERAFASAFGFKHAVALNSLSSAYHLAFLALGIQSGHRVGMSALTSISACDAARYVGADVKVIDVARNSFHVSLESIEEAHATSKLDFFVLDHTFGSPSPIPAAWLRERGIKVIEDFSGLIGSEQNGAYFGAAGDIAVCGLSEMDHLTTGNGGVVVTADAKVHQSLQALRYGPKRKPETLAYDYRLGDFQAAMGLDQLSRIGVTLARRKKIGQKYLESLRSTKHEAYFTSPGVDSYLRFPVVVNKPNEEVVRYFNSIEIGVTRCHEMPLHHLLGLARMEFPNAERLYQKSVSIPIYPSLTANNVERIAASLRGLL
ncbi:MAG: DegT/DnrJ/EryC1/StrS aminotransferase family protein [Spirochaetia bacterium]|nr:DegT/DnrJ/EryC1/StrS aminotransferase family protein [Spirochaetia bacterium]